MGCRAPGHTQLVLFLQGSAAATKAQFDKFVLDKAEEKAAFDHVLAQTAAEASQQKAIADKALVDFGELQVGGRGWCGTKEMAGVLTCTHDGESVRGHWRVAQVAVLLHPHA